MKRLYLILSLILTVITLAESRAQCIQTVDFSTWEATGDTLPPTSCNGNTPWSILSNGTALLSGCNTNFPTMYVGPDTLINVRITGTFRVEDYADDDYIGFVFGFKQTWNFPWVNGNMTHEYYLFDWKKNNQTYAGYSALEGFSLNRVNGTWAKNIANVFPNFWSHGNSTQFNVLQSSFSTTSGWVPYTYYDFELLYTPTRAVVLIDSDTIFDESGCFEPGLFGFYNYSQQYARYLNFNYELFVDYQIESEHVCFGDTAQFFFIDTSGCAGANAFSNLDTFYWELGDGTITTDTNPAHLYPYPDTFLVSLIATDINGCTDTSQKPIYIHPPAQAGIQVGNGCHADSLPMMDSTYLPMGGYVDNWLWDMGDGSGTDTVENPLYLYNAPGTYTIQLIIETNAGCLDTATEEVTIYDLPDVAFSYENACEGFAVTLSDSTEATTWPIAYNEWDVDTDGVAELTGINASYVYNTYGNYPIELKVTDSVGCADSLEKLIVVHPIPDADFLAPGVCHNDATQFIDSTEVALGDIDYWEWDFGAGNSTAYTANNAPSPGPSHIYDNPGPKNVQLTVTSDSGCVDSVLKTIQVYYLPVANFFTDSVCDNQMTSFTQASVSQSGSLSYFKWEFGGDSAFSATAQHNFTTPGNHLVTLTVASNLGCEDTAQRYVRVFPTPHTAFGWVNNVCEGDPLPFTDQSTIPQVTPGGDQIVDWEWVFNNQDTQYVQHPVYQTTKFENINVRLTTTSDRGCTTFSENTALIFPLPTANFAVDPACAEDSTQFSNSSKVQNGVIAETYWTFGDGNSSTLEHPRHPYQLPGTYSVTLEAHSNKGCVDSITKEVVIPATPVASFSLDPEDGCSPLRVSMQNTSAISNGVLSYEWYLNDSLISEEAFPSWVITNDTLIPTMHTVKLIARSELGCEHTSKQSQAITVLPSPIADFTVADASISMYEPEVQFHNTSQHGIRWWWSFGDGKTSNSFAPKHTYTMSGQYPVEQVVWNEYECTDTAFLHHLIVDPVTTMFIPNSFTPNGDGINDTWFVKGFNEDNMFEITVWNRWGELMFESNDIGFTWDGTMPNSDKRAPIGAYVFRILYMTSDDKEEEVSGTFLLAN